MSDHILTCKGDQLNMAVLFWYLVKSDCTRTLDKLLDTRYQKYKAMFNWSPYILGVEIWKWVLQLRSTTTQHHPPVNLVKLSSNSGITRYEKYETRRSTIYILAAIFLHGISIFNSVTYLSNYWFERICRQSGPAKQWYQVKNIYGVHLLKCWMKEFFFSHLKVG